VLKIRRKKGVRRELDPSLLWDKRGKIGFVLAGPARLYIS
jgi:hypothetical protein